MTKRSCDVLFDEEHEVETIAWKAHYLPTHPRDNKIRFEEQDHLYLIQFISVTTLIHSHFPEFNPDHAIEKIRKSSRYGPSSPYFGKTDQQIKEEWDRTREEASNAGTRMHDFIETWMNKYKDLGTQCKVD